MKAIAVFGRKGGSGKTLLSHFLSHGMSLLDFTTIMLQTDVRTARPPEIIDTRSYMLASTRGDGTDLTLIQKVIDKASALPNSVLVMDGGANRRNLDLALAPLADLVLVPTGYSAEDIAVAEQDYWELTGRLSEVGSSAEVYIVMNRWPGLTRKLNHIQQKQWVREFLARCDRQDNLFPYFVPDMPSLLDMAHGEDPKYTPLIDGRARSFARLVARKLGMAGMDGMADMDAADLTDEDDGSAPPAHAVLAAE